MAESRGDCCGGDGGGSAALAASPAPWKIEYDPGKRPAGVDTELKKSERTYQFSKDPAAAYYYHKLGFLASDYGSREQAKALLGRALEASTDDASLTGTLGWVKYGHGEASMSATREGLREAAEFAKSIPAYDLGIYVSLLARYGEILWESDMHSEAIEVWGEGLALDFEHGLRHEDLRQTLVKYAEDDGVEVRRDQTKMADLNPGVLRTLKNAVEGLER